MHIMNQQQRTPELLLGDNESRVWGREIHVHGSKPMGCDCHKDEYDLISYDWLDTFSETHIKNTGLV